jgi:thiol:disulfide interchange protein
LAALEQFTSEGKTVLIDFTADWCLTCKTLERTVLNTAATRKYVRENGIVTMVGDVTRYPPETSELLETLSGGRQVPVLAIFPGSRPNEPIVLKNAYTPGILFEKLKEAGPSKGAAAAASATAMKTK